MKKRFSEITDDYGKVTAITTQLLGTDLLSVPSLNKGCAFPREERERFGLIGKLPYHLESMDQQVARYYRQYKKKNSDLGRNLFLNNLKQNNLTLFYKLVSQNLIEMLPIIYTPTIGDAVENFSYEFNKPAGLIITYPDRDKVEMMLDSRINREVDLIIVTDGEGVLGIGDWGTGGLDICVGKLMVYTLIAGINPRRTLPIQLDCGTNNENLLNDPMYLGWRHKRIAGTDYDAFIDTVVSAIRKKFPHIYLHWEDFGRDNARKNLDRYRNKMCTFNDDIQGTGATALASVLSGLKVKNESLAEQRIVFFGAGSAGVGIADQIYQAMRADGMDEKSARQKFWLIDRDGLLFNDHPNLIYFQKPYARDRKDVADWKIAAKNISLMDVVKNLKPTILIGCSTVFGAFSSDIVKTMATQVARPIIMPLSNPTSKAEAKPQDIYDWTDGKAIIATGSPFEPIRFNGHEIPVAQCNNAYIFPGLGLGILAVKAKRVSDEMITAACHVLSENSPAMNDPLAPLLPSFNDMNEISKKIALKVAEKAREQGFATFGDNLDLKKRIDAIFWKPEYLPLILK